VAVAAAEWLHGTGAAWAWATGAAALATAALAVRRRTALPGATALAALVLGAVVVTGMRRVRDIECCWREVRAGRVPRDSSQLKEALASAVTEARRLAGRGMTAALLTREAAFDELREAVRSGTRTRGVERGVVALGLVLLLMFITAPAGGWRWLVTVAAAWTVARALQDSARWAGLFSPASFYRPMLGGFSASAGALAALGAVLLLTAAAVWRRGLARRWWSLVGAGVLVLAAPYVVRYFGRGITPP